MYYELNISKNGRHFFATAERSITSDEHLKDLIRIFRASFPESEGYKMTVTLYRCMGVVLDPNNLDESIKAAWEGLAP